MIDPISLGIGLAKLVGPKIVSWVAGDKAGNVAKEVINHATEITGMDDPEDALNVLQADPTLALEFKKAVMDNEVTLEQMYLADRQNARQRDIDMRKAGYTNRRADLMVGVAFLTLCAIIWAVWGYKESIPGEVLTLFTTMVGAILKMLSDAFQFEFGSSRGSKEKDQFLR